MNLQELKKVSPKIDDELKVLFAKYGMTFVTRSARIDPSNGELTYKVTLATTAGGADDILRTDFKRYAMMFGLKAEWLDRTLTHRNETYRVVGLYPKKSKFPILVERVSDKKRVLLTAEDVTLRLK